MKAFFVFLTGCCLFVFSFSTTSCTKESPRTDTAFLKIPDTVKPIVGLWIGPLHADNEPKAGPLWYTFYVLADHTIFSHSQGADGNTYYSDGTWTLDGTAFSATITSTTPRTLGVVQIFTATYDSLKGVLGNGVWVNRDGSARGDFVLTRVE